MREPTTQPPNREGESGEWWSEVEVHVRMWGFVYVQNQRLVRSCTARNPRAKAQVKERNPARLDYLIPREFRSKPCSTKLNQVLPNKA